MKKIIKGILALSIIMTSLVLISGCSRKKVKVKYEESIIEFKFNESDSTASVRGIKRIINKEEVTDEQKESITELDIPDTVEKDNKTYKVVSIEAGSLSSVLSGLKNVKKITLPENIKLGEYTFAGMKALEEIVIPKGVEIIPKEAFSGCINLKKVEIGNDVKEIGDFAFENCESLEKITLPDSVTKLGRNAFKDCKKLSSVKLSKNLTTISSALFSGCESLEKIDLPKGITQIESSAFYKCSKLQKIDIPDGVTQIKDSAFSGCSNLKEVSLPKTLTTIEVGAFRDCSLLEKITIPASVEKMSQHVFENCTNLTINVEGKSERPESGWSYNWNFAGSTDASEIPTNWNK